MQRSMMINIAAFALMLALLAALVFRQVGAPLAIFLFVLLALVPFLASFERRRPQARELVPVAVLAAVAALGRVIFAPLPQVKPTSAVVIVAGMAFGPQAGFMTGAAAALASNIFFGQGPYTPWQMFAWGLMGFFAGFLARRGIAKNRALICLYGFVWGFVYGFILDSYTVLSYVRPLTLKSVFLTFAAGFYYNLVHAASNALFLLCIARPWMRILLRVKTKYGLLADDIRYENPARLPK